MVAITMIYNGELRCTATHTPSQSTLITDAPVDNHGKGEAFSPTDLVATALGTCILTTMAIVADKLGVDLRGATARVEKGMSATPPRRIATLTAHIHVPGPVSAEHREKLENAAHKCPVHQSLHPDIHAPIAISWEN